MFVANSPGKADMTPMLKEDSGCEQREAKVLRRKGNQVKVNNTTNLKMDSSKNKNTCQSWLCEYCQKKQKKEVTFYMFNAILTDLSLTRNDWRLTKHNTKKAKDLFAVFNHIHSYLNMSGKVDRQKKQFQVTGLHADFFCKRRSLPVQLK